MNWQLIIWFAGILATIYGLKFVFELFKSLLGKESRENMMEALGESVTKANKKLTNKIKKKSNEMKKKKEEENRAIVRVL